MKPTLSYNPQTNVITSDVADIVLYKQNGPNWDYLGETTNGTYTPTETAEIMARGREIGNAPVLTHQEVSLLSWSLTVAKTFTFVPAYDYLDYIEVYASINSGGNVTIEVKQNGATIKTATLSGPKSLNWYRTELDLKVTVGATYTITATPTSATLYWTAQTGASFDHKLYEVGYTYSSDSEPIAVYSTTQTEQWSYSVGAFQTIVYADLSRKVMNRVNVRSDTNRKSMNRVTARSDTLRNVANTDSTVVKVDTLRKVMIEDTANVDTLRQVNIQVTTSAGQTVAKMVLEVRQNKEIKIPVKIIDSVTGSPKTGIIAPTVLYCKDAGEVLVLSNPGWKESNAGLMPGSYWLTIPVTLLDISSFIEIYIMASGAKTVELTLKVMPVDETDTYNQVQNTQTAISTQTNAVSNLQTEVTGLRTDFATGAGGGGTTVELGGEQVIETTSATTTTGALVPNTETNTVELTSQETVVKINNTTDTTKVELS